MVEQCGRCLGVGMFLFPLQVFMAIHGEVARSLEIHSDPLTRAAPGANWVRGWDDREKPTQVGAPPGGNQ